MRFKTIFLFFCISMFIYCFSMQVFAGKETTNVDDYGNIYYITIDKKATTGVRYKTIGWSVYNETRTKSVIVSSLEYEPPKDIEGGYIESHFKTPYELLFKRIGDIEPNTHTWRDELKSIGGYITLDGVMTVIEGTTQKGFVYDDGARLDGEVYTILEDNNGKGGIKHARNWSDPDSLNSHFNIGPFYFPPHYESREKISKPNSKIEITADLDNVGEPIFNVLEGIPSKEKLRIFIGSNSYYDLNYTVVTSASFTVSASGMVRGKRQEVDVDIVRPVQYYRIDNLDIYKLTHAIARNGAFPNGSVEFKKDDLPNPSASVKIFKTNEHLDTSEFPKDNEIPGNFDSIYALKHKAIDMLKDKKVRVRNDGFTFENKVVLSSDFSSTNTASDVQNITLARMEYKSGNETGVKIPDTRLNGDYNSTGSISFQIYRRLVDGKLIDPNWEEDENGKLVYHEPPTIVDNLVSDDEINDVVVHTPVVCYPKVLDDVKFNQEVIPVVGRSAVILDRPSQITIPTNGMHRSIDGYYNRDYSKYTKEKQVRFPFDVYFDTTEKQKDKFLKANTWVSIRVEKNVVNFYTPTWVKEGDYNVDFREIAINAPDLSKTQISANIDLNNYIATNIVPVRVIGRLYGFKITDINNYPAWESVFRAEKGLTKHSDSYYWVGLNDQNGKPVRDNGKYILPILNGSHPTLKNFGVLSTGYRFKFELQTIGNYFGDKDCIDIIPKFYYVSKEGDAKQKRIEVDLYYNEKIGNVEKYFVKIGSTEDRNNTKFIKLGDSYRNVSQNEISNTAKILGIKDSQFANATAKLGWLFDIVLSKPLRTFIGDPKDAPQEAGNADIKVDVDTLVRRSVQKWYGEYYLPDQLYAVPKVPDISKTLSDKTLDGKENFWLKNGYIIVNFNIKTVKEGNFKEPVLSYMNAPNGNMWKIEGGVNSKVEKKGDKEIKFEIQSGDVVFYSTDRRASQDYSEGGTH